LIPRKNSVSTLDLLKFLKEIHDAESIINHYQIIFVIDFSTIKLFKNKIISDDFVINIRIKINQELFVSYK